MTSEEAADIAINKTAAALDRSGITESKIIQEFKIIAFSDLKNHVSVDEGGALCVVPLDQMGRKSRAVKKVREKSTITESKDGATLNKISTVEYELYDKIAALETLASMRGMKVPEKIKHEGSLTINVLDWKDAGDDTT
jgi:hypothetical protein